MTETITDISDLRSLAQQHALAIVEAEARDSTGVMYTRNFCGIFNSRDNPLCRINTNTALYRTFCNMLVTAIFQLLQPR